MAKSKKLAASAPIDLLWLGAAVVVLAAFFVLYSGTLSQRANQKPEVQGVTTVNDALGRDFQELKNSLNEL